MTNHWVDITRVKRRVPLLEQELYLSEEADFILVFSGVRVARSLVFCLVCLQMVVCPLTFFF
jgi:hypothetical protein